MTVEKTDEGKAVLMDPKAELAKLPEDKKTVLMTSIKTMPDSIGLLAKNMKVSFAVIELLK